MVHKALGRTWPGTILIIPWGWDGILACRIGAFLCKKVTSWPHLQLGPRSVTFLWNPGVPWTAVSWLILLWLGWSNWTQAPWGSSAMTSGSSLLCFFSIRPQKCFPISPIGWCTWVASISITSLKNFSFFEGCIQATIFRGMSLVTRLNNSWIYGYLAISSVELLFRIRAHRYGALPSKRNGNVHVL